MKLMIIGMLGLLALMAACGSSEPAAQAPAPPEAAAAPPAQTGPAATAGQADQAAPADQAASSDQAAPSGETDQAAPADQADQPPAAGEGAAADGPSPDTAAVLVPVADDPPPLEIPTEADAQAAKAALGANDFAFALAGALSRSTPPEENLVVSPFSVWLPLAALAAAATEDTRPSLLAALFAEGLDPADLDRAAARLIPGLTNQSLVERDPARHKNPLRVANAIFVGSDRTIRPEFAKRFLDFYQGRSFAVDFASDQTPALVNAWIAENTGGKITDLIDRFDPATVAAIANAIYLSSNWHKPFDEEATRSAPFHSPAGDVEARLMERTGDFQYFESGELQAVTLRLVDHASMTILLPKGDRTDWLIQGLGAKAFADILEGSAIRHGRLVLPKFKVSSGTLELSDILSSLGVKLFSASHAALTGGLVEGEDPISLAAALQQAVVEVDEKGVTAAAATVMTAVATAFVPRDEPFEMICDRPFVFALTGEAFDNPALVMFTGIVNRP